MAEKRRVLRMPGRVYREFAVIAIAMTGLPGLAPEQEALCDALSRVAPKRRGRGYTVLVPVEPEHVRLLMEWVSGRSPKFLRDYRDDVLRALEELEASGDAEED